MSDEAIMFSPKANQALVLARKKADELNHNFIGTEHLILGIVALGQGTAFEFLAKLDITAGAVESLVYKKVGKGPGVKIFGDVPYTPRSRKCFRLAKKEAESLKHDEVGTGHLLLGIIHEGDGVAADVLRKLGLPNIEQVRLEIAAMLNPESNVIPSLSQKDDSADDDTCSALAKIALQALPIQEGLLCKFSTDPEKGLGMLKVGILKLLSEKSIPKQFHDKLSVCISDLINDAHSRYELELYGSALKNILGADAAIQFARFAFDGTKQNSVLQKNWGTVVQILTGKPVSTTIDFFAKWPIGQGD